MAYQILFNGTVYKNTNYNQDYSIVTNNGYQVVPVIDLSKYLQIRNIIAGSNVTVDYSSTGVTINSTGGGGGTITGATNGLSLIGKNVGLGGNLTGNTTINTTDNAITKLTLNTPLTLSKTITGNTGYFKPQYLNITDYSTTTYGSQLYNNINVGVKPRSNNFIFYQNVQPDNGSSAIDLMVLGSDGNNNNVINSEIYLITSDILNSFFSGTSFNHTSANYSGDTIPQYIYNAVLLHSNDVWYIFNDGLIFGIGHFNISLKGNTLYTNSSGNYTGSTITSVTYVSEIFLSDDGISVGFGTVGTNIFNTTKKGNVYYSSSSGNYTGTTMPTGSISSGIISNGFLYLTFQSGLSSNLGIWKLNLSNHGAIKITTTSANYSGNALPSNVTGKVVLVGSDLWFITGSGLWKYIYSTNTGTAFTNISTNYSGDKFTSTLSYSSKMIYNVTKSSLAFYDTVSNTPTNLFEFNTSTLVSTKSVLVNYNSLGQYSSLLKYYSDDLLAISDTSGLIFNGSVYITTIPYITNYYSGFVQLQLNSNYIVPQVKFSTTQTNGSISSDAQPTDYNSNTLVNKIYLDTYLNFGTAFTISNLFGLKNIKLSTAITTGLTANIYNDVKLKIAGYGIYIKEGTNATSGSITLSGGTAVVTTTKVTANSRIQLTSQGGGTNHGAQYISARTVGSSFTITSTNASDTDKIAWFLIEPS